jgi:hypothetical protein
MMFAVNLLGVPEQAIETLMRMSKDSPLLIVGAHEPKKDLLVIVSGPALRLSDPAGYRVKFNAGCSLEIGRNPWEHKPIRADWLGQFRPVQQLFEDARIPSGRFFGKVEWHHSMGQESLYKDNGQAKARFDCRHVDICTRPVLLAYVLNSMIPKNYRIPNLAQESLEF